MSQLNIIDLDKCELEITDLTAIQGGASFFDFDGDFAFDFAFSPAGSLVAGFGAGAAIAVGDGPSTGVIVGVGTA